MCCHGMAHWRHLSNTIEPSVCCGNAALCQITLTTCVFTLNVDYAQRRCSCAVRSIGSSVALIVGVVAGIGIFVVVVVVAVVVVVVRFIKKANLNA